MSRRRVRNTEEREERRKAILAYLAAHPDSTAAEIARGMGGVMSTLEVAGVIQWMWMDLLCSGSRGRAPTWRVRKWGA